MKEKNMEGIVAPEHPLRADKYPLEEYNAIGRRGITRKDGYEKASGYAVYTTDVQLQGMLWLRILTCPVSPCAYQDDGYYEGRIPARSARRAQVRRSGAPGEG